jgi:hypothetical protein
MQASKDFFNGKHFNNATTGEGLKSYLDYVKAVRSGQQLSTIIDNQFAASLTANTLNASFQVRLILTILKCLPLMMYCNKCYIKLDMMQALNITIDYVDGDGD